MNLWRLPPLTLLLGTLAACALLGAAVAAAGMGGRYALLADDPALVPALPDTRQVQVQRGFDPSGFTEAGERPLFSADRRPAPVQIAADESDEPQSAGSISVTSIVMTPGFQAALVRLDGSEDSQRVRVGDTVPGSPSWRLLELSPRQAVFDGPDGRVGVDLRLFDGQGGQAPTRIAAASVQQGAAAAGGPAARRAAQIEREGERGRNGQAEDGAGEDDGSRLQPSGQRVEGSERGEAVREQMSPEEQAEAIRRRIEERRRQLRERAQRSTDEVM